MIISFNKDQTFKYIERYYDTTDPDTRELIKIKPRQSSRKTPLIITNNIKDETQISLSLCLA